MLNSFVTSVGFEPQTFHLVPFTQVHVQPFPMTITSILSRRVPQS